MKVIQGATVYTMNSKNDVIKDCDVLIVDGKITAIGQNLSISDQAEVISAKGLVVTPGLIDAHTHVGIQGEITDGMKDHNEISNHYTPLMSAIDAINPHHHSFNDARSGGVTTVQTGNGSHNVIGGVWCVVKTTGNTVEEMLIRNRSGLKGALGENPKNRHGQVGKKEPFTRMSVAKWLRHGFERAQVAISEDRISLAELYKHSDQDLIPFIEVLQRKMPLRLHAHRADDIGTAIRIAKEFDVELTIEHCTEGHKIVSLVKESGYSVTLGPLMGQPGKYETKELNPENPRILSEAGIEFAINTDHPVSPIQHLSISAANAVKYGMDETEAMRAITITPAKICGVDERIGSIEIGKDADLVIWSDHPFKMRGHVLTTLINGKVVYERNTEVKS